MTNQDLEQFAMLLAALSEAFGQPATKERTAIYFEALKDLPLSRVQGAVWEIIKTRTTATFPKVAEIREAGAGNAEAQAIIAWDKVIESIRSIGHYHSVVFDDPIIHHAIDRLFRGWEDLCMMSTEDLTWAKKDFIKHYQIYTKQDIDIIPKLVGFVELNNRLAGYEDRIPKPVFIGDHAKCRALLTHDSAPHPAQIGDETTPPMSQGGSAQKRLNGLLNGLESKMGNGKGRE